MEDVIRKLIFVRDVDIATYLKCNQKRCLEIKVKWFTFEFLVMKKS